MRADNSSHIIAAARLRSQATRKRAAAALRRMHTAGQAVTFGALAREAGVSRSWLYSQPDLRAEIERLRQRHRHAADGPTIPDRQRASDTSLLRRLELATARISALETDNQRLRQALAEALGDRRAARISQPRGDTPTQRIPAMTEPPAGTTSTTPSTTQNRRSQP